MLNIIYTNRPNKLRAKLMKNIFVEELRWRGMLHDIMPDTENHLNEKSTTGYIGFDPTADSLHIGSLVQIMILSLSKKD